MRLSWPVRAVVAEARGGKPSARRLVATLHCDHAWHDMAINVVSRNDVSRETLPAWERVSRGRTSLGFAARGSRLLLSIVLLSPCVLAGCDRDDVGPKSGVRTPARPQIDSAQLLVEADLRRPDAALALAFLRGDPDHRALAARGLGAIGSEGALVLLQRGLADANGRVRELSSFGLARSGLPFDALVGAFAAERDPQVAGLILRDLGRVVDRKRAGPLFRALDGPVPRDACASLSHLAQRDPDFPPEIVRRLVELANSAEPATALDCLGTLGALPSAALAPHADTLTFSARASRGLEPALAHAWLRVVSRLGVDSSPILQDATMDADPAVAALAFQLLARTPSPPGATATAYREKIELRLGSFLSPARTDTDPVALEAAFDALPLVSGASALSGWLASVLHRLSPDASEASPITRASLRCAAARALDHLLGRPEHLLKPDFGPVPTWVPATASIQVAATHPAPDSRRLQWLRLAFDTGDWHVKQAVMLATRGLAPAVVRDLLLNGLAADHLEVKAAALESLAVLAPRFRTPTAPLPDHFPTELRAAFQSFHVTHHVRGLRAFLSVVRLARLRAELGSVTVLARSEVRPVRLDALSLLEEWGHPPPRQAPDPVTNPISRDDLLDQPTSVAFSSRAGAFTITFDPKLAPATVSRLIRWLGAAGKELEVSDWLPGHQLRLTQADGLSGPPLRSEIGRSSVVRGTVILPGLDRDGSSASLVIRLAPASELEGEVTVVGRVTAGLDVLGRLVLGEAITVPAAAPNP